MSETLITNIRANWALVERNAGASVVTAVSGSKADKEFWQQHFETTKADVFRADGSAHIISVLEGVRKGNFLGTLNAWIETLKVINQDKLPNLALMSMVFGMGTRFSPFTQALSNRKSAFPIPLKSRHSNTYLCTADMSNLYANTWLEHLQTSGFKGVIVKWGDEAIIPGKQWTSQDYSNVDAIRFVWKTPVTPDLAREKEWITIDENTGWITHQLTRQPVELLKARLEKLSGDNLSFAVNLGSLAISYPFLEAALEVFKDDIADDSKWVDWDPYVWMALHCQTEEEWQAEIAHEDAQGKDGIRQLENRLPGFYNKVSQLRQAVERRNGRPLAVAALDFGEAFWVDLGLHITLRANMNALTENSVIGNLSRELYKIPHARDENGNLILNSRVPANAKIKNSIIIDSVIESSATVVNRGVIVGSKCGHINMPEGGAALFCNANVMVFQGGNGIAFQSKGDEIILQAGDRHTTLQVLESVEHLRANESILDYKGENYVRPILDNRISFSEAATIMAEAKNH